MQAKRAADRVTIQASAEATETAGANGSTVYLPGMINGLVFELDVTAAATVAADTLDVFIQTQLDGTNWVDVSHFTQVLGDGGAKRYYTKIASDTALTEFENGAALGAAAVRNLLGDTWRARWVVVNDTDPAFTFSVTVVTM